MSGFAQAVAHSNIALAKYWGKADAFRNLTAVPSLSLTLAALRTTTSVRFDSALEADEFELAGARTIGRPFDRVIKLLDSVRSAARIEARARVESVNDFPTAAGLASSASGFAALALAASRAAGLALSLEQVSALARAASASAARSVYGGYVALEARGECAERVRDAAEFPLEMLVAVTVSGPKSTASTDGMAHTQDTSPYYPAWLSAAPGVYAQVRRAVEASDFDALGPAVEHSALMMHASMLAADPALIYFAPATLGVMERVRAFRKSGGRAYFTMDAGPHVKVLVEPTAAAELERELEKLEGVTSVLRSAAGPDAYWVEP
ncbi:MAG TPA: diphosphomevalonate decarboxylase [Polyangiaceae bacterium]|jgi:diphosphomevalonate decarboxylase|nr:diphosphomevalonate decarboxylase [Polyangiaceae bacterium]